jgi:hypothetical protein
MGGEGRGGDGWRRLLIFPSGQMKAHRCRMVSGAPSTTMQKHAISIQRLILLLLEEKHSEGTKLI